MIIFKGKIHFSSYYQCTTVLSVFCGLYFNLSYYLRKNDSIIKFRVDYTNPEYQLSVLQNISISISISHKLEGNTQVVMRIIAFIRKCGYTDNVISILSIQVFPRNDNKTVRSESLIRYTVKLITREKVRREGQATRGIRFICIGCDLCIGLLNCFDFR